MKRYLWILLAVLALAGCKNDKKKSHSEKAPKPVPEVSAPIVQETTLSETLEGSDGMASLEIDVDVQYYQGGSPEVTDAINEVILGATFGDNYAGQSFEEAKESLYKTFMSDIYEGMMSDYNEYTLYGSFSGEYDKYICYEVFENEFFGGAHGMDTMRAYVFNKDTGALVTEEDLFVPGYERLLSERMAKALREDLGEDFEYVSEEGIAPNGNFILDQDGISYIFNPYEIASYAMGTLTATVSWDDLQDILKQ